MFNDYYYCVSLMVVDAQQMKSIKWTHNNIDLNCVLIICVSEALAPAVGVVDVKAVVCG